MTLASGSTLLSLGRLLARPRPAPPHPLWAPPSSPLFLEVAGSPPPASPSGRAGPRCAPRGRGRRARPGRSPPPAPSAACAHPGRAAVGSEEATVVRDPGSRAAAPPAADRKQAAGAREGQSRPPRAQLGRRCRPGVPLATGETKTSEPTGRARAAGGGRFLPKRAQTFLWRAPGSGRTLAPGCGGRSRGSRPRLVHPTRRRPGHPRPVGAPRPGRVPEAGGGQAGASPPSGRACLRFQ